MNNKRGVALSISMMLIFILVLLGSAILIQALNQKSMADRAARTANAFWLADAGIQHAKYNLESDNCNNFYKFGTATKCTSCGLCRSDDKTLTGGKPFLSKYCIFAPN